MEEEDVHDLLIIPANGQLYRCRATAKENASGVPNANAGGYDHTPLERVPFVDPAFRKTINIARPGRGNQSEPKRGPAFSILPNKVDPATSQICCYLVNAENARASNPWTFSAWSSEPDPTKHGELTPEPQPTNGHLEVLLAGSAGRVYYVAIDESLATIAGGPTTLDLRVEGEVYTQLRNGLIAGSAWYQEHRCVLPLINVTALTNIRGY